VIMPASVSSMGICKGQGAGIIASLYKAVKARIEALNAIGYN
jgi:hypothetical protein